MEKTKQRNIQSNVVTQSVSNNTAFVTNGKATDVPLQKIPVTFPVEVAFRCSSKKLKRASLAVRNSSKK